MTSDISARERIARTLKIRKFNDDFRRTLQGGRILLTPGVNALSLKERSELLSRVRTFSDFECGGDPYGEHDFGAITTASGQFFWKIDYYSPDLNAGSEDPSDRSKTTRVLTVMDAREY